MAKTKALVDGISSISTPLSVSGAESRGGGASPVRVTFAGGASATLDVADPQSAVWASVLEDLRRTSAPAYVELDPTTERITRLLLPGAFAVTGLDPTPDGKAVEVSLTVSHARHFLQRSHVDFKALLSVLEAARKTGNPVLVTESPDGHELIDVQPLPKGARPEAGEGPLAEAAVAAPPLGAPVSSARAQELFNLVNGKSCCPASAPAPCIPFLYPDDGCWGRAHEMCRLMIAAGAAPEKVWIYGSLRVATANHPNCQVQWGWHVAPTLAVNTGSTSATYVIDPSLFPGPVPRATWAGVQGDAAPTLVASSAAVFYRAWSGAVSYDPAYTQTQTVLNNYRNQLRLRCASAAGPPPYPNCLARGPGVQWIGLIGARATTRWFTHSWPANWHVVWTVMPLTPCAGAAQLSWSVQVERASAAYSTYWITVTNLTSDPVRFEGRYDILSR